jgi:SNF2 family DNA or RNA helicase
VFSQYKFLNPSIFGQSFYTFRGRYFNMVGYGKHTPVLRKSMEPELTQRVHSIAFRVTKAGCLDLPETTDVMRFVALENEAVKLYKDIARDSYAELAKGEVTVTNILTKLMRLSQLTGGFIRADESSKHQQISRAKLDALEDVIESVQAEGGKIVVIARFLPEIRAISDMLDKCGFAYSLITGDVKDRSAEVEKFQNDPNVTVFVGQIQTAAMGITLTAASTMVFYSLDYSMSNYEQARARIHRVGQKNACTYIHLIAKSTIDEKVLKALRDKTDLARGLIDDYKQCGVNPFN